MRNSGRHWHQGTGEQNACRFTIVGDGRLLPGVNLNPRSADLRGRVAIDEFRLKTVRYKSRSRERIGAKPAVYPHEGHA